MTTQARKEIRRKTDEGTDLWRVVTAPTIWAAHFLVCYVSAAIYCEKAGRGVDLLPVRWLILGTTAAALVALGLLFFSAWRVRAPSITLDDLQFEANAPEERHRFLTHVVLMLCTLSIVAVVYVTIPALMLDTCR